MAIDSGGLREGLALSGETETNENLRKASSIDERTTEGLSDIEGNEVVLVESNDIRPEEVSEDG